MLREDEVAVDEHVEHAAASLLERWIHTLLPLDRGRETRGPGEIVSGHAVLDPDFHRADLRTHFDARRGTRDVRTEGLIPRPPRQGPAASCVRREPSASSTYQETPQR